MSREVGHVASIVFGGSVVNMHRRLSSICSERITGIGAGYGRQGDNERHGLRMRLGIWTSLR